MIILSLNSWNSRLVWRHSTSFIYSQQAVNQQDNFFLKDLGLHITISCEATQKQEQTSALHRTGWHSIKDFAQNKTDNPLGFVICIQIIHLPYCVSQAPFDPLLQNRMKTIGTSCMQFALYMGTHRWQHDVCSKQSR